MLIQIGQIYLNKTFKYLAPCLKIYGEEVTSLINSLQKLAVGIGDIAYYEISGIDIKEHLFILCDISDKNFKKKLELLKGCKGYVDDYSYDDIHIGHQHMIVFNVPETAVSAYHKFVENRFSKMFSKDEIEELFNTQRGKTPSEKQFYSSTIQVLTKDETYRTEWVEHLNTVFCASVKPEEFEGELDYPLLRQNEFFNYYE